MLINKNVVNELYDDAGYERLQRAKAYVKQGKVNIKKVIYGNKDNIELTANVLGTEEYQVFIKIEKGEIENVHCTCPDYEKTYGACKHIVATIEEFLENKDYTNVFEEEKLSQIPKQEIKNTLNKDNYKIFRQLINEFYDENAKEDIKLKENIKIEPILIYDKFEKSLKIEFKIGTEKMYKLKDLTQFLISMQRQEKFKYGEKLEFVHKQENFDEKSQDILKYILKYAEIIYDVNQNYKNSYYGTKIVPTSYITITNSGLDEIYNIFEDREIQMKKDFTIQNVKFVNNNPDIKFNIEKKEIDEYKIKPNIDIFEYTVFAGAENTYIMIENIIYKCTKSYVETVLKFLNVFRKNFTSEIAFNKKDLPNFFSLVLPNVKEEVNLEKIEKKEIEKYMPKDLAVKLFLDIDDNDFITAEIKFCYGDFEFNPLRLENIVIARNLAKEAEALNIFYNEGFLFDNKNSRFVLTNEEKIFNFLNEDILEYMKKFEVLATDNFKQKEIKKPKIIGIGVKVENNLLDIDFSNLDFDKSEIKEIMQKYKIKKRYHKLKDGSFLSLEDNEDLNFIDNLISGTGIDYKELEKGKIRLPAYRSMYLDTLLENLPNTTIEENNEFKKIVDGIEGIKKEEFSLPKKLNAQLREYQKTGYKWLKTLDEYKFGGILADDMGLRKNNTTFSCNFRIYRKYKKRAKKTINSNLSKFTFFKLVK